MSYSCDETYDVYHEQEQVARKQHTCEACDMTIEPGRKYTRVYVLFDGRKESYKRCVRCQFLHEHLRALAPGEMWPDERLACGTDYADEWGPAPTWVNELAFWSPGDPLPAINPCTPRASHRGAVAVECWVKISDHPAGYSARACRSWQAYASNALSGSGVHVCS